MNNIDKIKKIKDEIHNLSVRRSLINDASYKNLDLFNLKIIKKNKIEKYKLEKFTKYLNNSSERLLKKITLNNKKIIKLQEECNHKHSDGSDAFEYEGHDSHKDYYICTICGKEISC